SSMLRHSPPWNEYVVSHHTQRSGQPVRRTNTVGQPIASASPWIEWKISVMRSRSAATAGAAVAALVLASLTTMPSTGLDAAQPLLREAGGLGAGVFADHGLERGLRGRRLLQFELAVADLEQRIGRFLALRELVQQVLERLQRHLVVGGDVVRLTQPVERIRGERMIRVLLDELAELARGADVVAAAQRLEGGVVGGLCRGVVGGGKRLLALGWRRLPCSPRCPQWRPRPWRRLPRRPVRCCRKPAPRPSCWRPRGVPGGSRG